MLRKEILVVTLGWMWLVFVLILCAVMIVRKEAEIGRLLDQNATLKRALAAEAQGELNSRTPSSTSEPVTEPLAPRGGDCIERTKRFSQLPTGARTTGPFVTARQGRAKEEE